MAFARSANTIYRRFQADPEFGAVFVIWQDAGFERASTADCQQLKAQFGLEMPVLVYADDDAASAVGFDRRHVHLVTERGARIVHRAEFEDQSFVPAIEAALAR